MMPALALGHATTHDRPDDFEEWRDAARACLMAGLEPDAVSWTGDLFAGESGPPPALPRAPQLKVSRAFLQLAQTAILHSEPQRFDLLYRLLWRLQRDPRLLEDHADPQIRRIEALAREVRRDIHKMRAFVRFRTVEDGEGQRFVAWFEPAHHILRRNASFFVNRFAAMRWSILTPRGALHWDGASLQEGPPAQRGDAPQDDPTEALWRDYYAATFNPARLKIGAMLKEMPRKYWKNMPETALIPQLVAGARARELAMVDAGADLFADAKPPESLGAIAGALQACRRCAIGCNGTRAVAGEGPHEASLMIVGEQPGDVEESEGRPFVGPAGQVLMDHLGHVGIDRARTYVTNAVKHFKFEQRGKHRLHKTPTAKEIDICRFWLDGERSLVKPKLILALGASAVRGILGKTASLEGLRDAPQKLEGGGELWVTNHPSYLLRLQDGARHEAEQRFAQDLERVAGRL